MKLLTVILNYKTPDMALDALAAAYRATEKIPRSKIVVVDNDSRDGSYQTISVGVAASHYPKERVEVIETGQNGGFGAGNNFAIRRALADKDPPDFIYILNSDAFPALDAVRELLRFLEHTPKAGMAGSFIHGTDGTPHETAFRFPTVWSELESGLAFGLVSKALKKYAVPIMPMPKETRQVDWLAGASMMIRREVLEEIGLFDETFFLYFEETDLCRRAQLAGWTTHYVVESRVAHVGSASTGMKKWKRIPKYWLESRAHYFRKNHGDNYLRAANLLFSVANGTFQVRRRIQGKNDARPPGFYRDFVRFSLLGRY